MKKGGETDETLDTLSFLQPQKGDVAKVCFVMADLIRQLILRYLVCDPGSSPG